MLISFIYVLILIICFFLLSFFVIIITTEISSFTTQLSTIVCYNVRWQTLGSDLCVTRLYCGNLNTVFAWSSDLDCEGATLPVSHTVWHEHMETKFWFRDWYPYLLFSQTTKCTISAAMINIFTYCTKRLCARLLWKGLLAHTISEIHNPAQHIPSGLLKAVVLSAFSYSCFVFLARIIRFQTQQPAVFGKK